jgi:hypothetical protein
VEDRHALNDRGDEALNNVGVEGPAIDEQTRQRLGHRAFAAPGGQMPQPDVLDSRAVAMPSDQPRCTPAES